MPRKCHLERSALTRAFAEVCLTTRMIDLDLSVLGSGGQHLRVPAEAHAQHGVVHHHEVVLSLVLQILGTHIFDHPGALKCPTS